MKTTTSGTGAGFTNAQKTILAHYRKINASATFFDAENVWVWARDIREDAQLAERYLEFRPEMGANQ
jgi:hypothetical protein